MIRSLIFESMTEGSLLRTTLGLIALDLCLRHKIRNLYWVRIYWILGRSIEWMTVK